MDIEQQVVSLELAKKLKELGVKQHSLFSWCKPESLNTFYTDGNEKYNNKFSLYLNKERYPYRDIDENYDYLSIGGCGCCSEVRKVDEHYAAFTVSELLEFMPIFGFSPHQLLKGIDFRECLNYCFRCDSLDIDNSIFKDKKAVDACAKFLIYVLENKIVVLNNERPDYANAMD